MATGIMLFETKDNEIKLTVPVDNDALYNEGQKRISDGR